jgi:hypothetical protein
VSKTALSTYLLHVPYLVTKGEWGMQARRIALVGVFALATLSVSQPATSS